MLLKNVVITFQVHLDAIEIQRELPLDKCRILLISLAEEQVYEKNHNGGAIVDCPSYPALITQ